LKEKPIVLNIASVAGKFNFKKKGLIGPPGLGIYASTKFAVVGYSDSLRREISDKVRVCIIEP
jgi:NADP-dependent 3-hydroxy acid dehydrogenase YdfG